MSENISNFQEPEVLKSVMDEVQKLGDNSQKNYDELQKSYKKLQEVVEKGIDGNKGQISKLTAEIASRQEELDKRNSEINSRIDAVETRMSAPSIITDPAKMEEVMKSAEMHFKSCLTIKEGRASVAAMSKTNIDIDSYKNYCKDLVDVLRMDEKQIAPEQYKRLSVGVDPDGGYTVTPFMASQILNRMFESDPIRQLATIETISTDAYEQLVDWSDVNVGWEGETVQGTETTTPQLNKKRIQVHNMYARVYATQQLLEDSSINIEAWLSNRASERMGRFESAAFVTGNGIGKPRGFLTYADGTSFGQVERVNMGAAAAITADGLIRVKYSLKEFFLNRGTWLVNRQTIRDIMLLKDGVGNYLWKPSIANDGNSTILDLPVRMSTTMPVVAANALSVALADWREAYYIVDRLGITVQRDPYTAKPFVEFYFRKRLGGDVMNWDAIKIGVIAV